MAKNRTKLTTDDIKSGYVVELRNGELRMCMRVGNFIKILVDPYGNWSPIISWDDRTFTFVSDRNYDIMAVYGLTYESHSSRCLVFDTTIRPLIWKRPEPVKMTVEEINEKLGYDVEIVASK